MHIITIGTIFTTIFMTGLIWFVQIVHYPLFEKVGKEVFVEYEKTHTQWTGYVVAPIMVAEFAFTSLWLYQIQSLALLIAFILLLVIWASTFFIQVPLHGRLSKNYNVELIQKLVKTNWIRTIAWTLKSGVLLELLV